MPRQQKIQNRNQKLNEIRIRRNLFSVDIVLLSMNANQKVKKEKSRDDGMKRTIDNDIHDDDLLACVGLSSSFDAANELCGGIHIRFCASHDHVIRRNIVFVFDFVSLSFNRLTKKNTGQSVCANILL